MTLSIFNDLVQGEEEWLAVRRGMVTASVVGQLITEGPPDVAMVPCPTCGADVGPCMSINRKVPVVLKGVHDARTRAAGELPPVLLTAATDKSRALIASLTAERITGRTDPVYITDDMARGNLHEPIARDKYADHNDVTVDEVGFMVREFAGGVRIGASPDGLVNHDGGIEIKCPRAKARIQTILADDVPPWHMAQVQANLLVSGRDWWDFISFSAGLAMFTKRVLPDPKWRDAIITAATNAEHAIAAMVQRFEDAAATLPATEYISPFEEITF